MAKHKAGDVVAFTIRRGNADARREDQDGRARRPRRRRRSASCSSPRSTSSCRSRFASTPATSAARRPGSRSRSKCSRSSATTSCTATRSPRPARSSPTAPSARSAASSRKRSARARRVWTRSSCRLGKTRATHARSGRPPHHPCGELSTGVARPGNAALSDLRNARISAVRSCRKVHVFRLDKPFYARRERS